MFILRMKGRKRNASSQQTAKRQCLKKKDERAKSAKKKPKVKEIRLKELKWFKCARCGAFKLNTKSRSLEQLQRVQDKGFIIQQTGQAQSASGNGDVFFVNLYTVQMGVY